MSKLQRVYDKSPVYFQHVMTTGAGYQRNRSRYGRAYWAERRWLVEYDNWSLEQKLEHQRKELLKLVRYAVVYSPFYRDLYSDVDLDAVDSVSSLNKLPIVDKEMLRKHMDQVYAISRRGAVVGHTGGTTGKSLEILMTPADMMK